MKNRIKYTVKIIIAALTVLIAAVILKLIPGTEYLFSPVMYFIIIIQCFRLISYIFKNTRILNKFHKPFRILIKTAVFLCVLVIVLLFAWYNYCFFPNDQDYIQKISDATEYKGNHLEEKELDLITNIHKAQFSHLLSKKDRNFLLNQDLKEKDIYIDENPYRNHPNNLKYASGRIFYYTYQKNSIVLNAESDVTYNIGKATGKRFLEFDTILPLSDTNGTVNIYYISDKKELLLHELIEPEIKPEIKPFRYSNVFDSLVFYFRHPGRSVLKDKDDWKKIRVEIPSYAGRLKIEFKSKDKKNNYLFLGSPAVYSTIDNKRNEHVNIVYIIFDLFSKQHVDLYEFYNEFSTMPYEDAVKKIGKRKIITPAIDRYKDDICLFENIFTAGQVTRPSITSLWTSQIFTKCRMPVFRNIITEENEQEFYNQNFTTLSNELSRQKYFTKQISCNAEGHSVSGVGADLGFDENYDYTMEPSELPENFRRVIEFLNENQNRKFFLYSHINVPHPPKWIPASYYLSSLPDTKFNTSSATALGNIRYLNDSLDKILQTIDKLKLRENTIVIITADHSMGNAHYFRGDITEKQKKMSTRESHRVADYYYRSVYTRKGRQFLLNDYMNIPFILIKPENLDIVPGKIDSYISSLDISPTLLDIVMNKKEIKFSGNSFKNLLFSNQDRKKSFNNFIPMVGRFQNGFVTDGRYKYYINLPGLYKYREKDGMRYIMQQEYVYDLKQDPLETRNLAYEADAAQLTKRLRNQYFEEFIEYPDKNFIQLSASASGKTSNYSIEIKSLNGKITYPKTYGDEIEYKPLSDKHIIFNCKVKDKTAIISFETNPPDSALRILIYKDGKPLNKNKIFSSVENINYFNNPVILEDKIDFHIAREYSKTGLEEKGIPSGAVSYYRIPVIYWMEMSLSDKDIKLSPGMKEVLRGWGYIQ
ncbi:MAG: sulfatase-like hydrolase/transferase [Spirochaetes bacterium]|nr:sulfatase-like hydrolase/transferase [Spirochaetota bacterium]